MSDVILTPSAITLPILSGATSAVPFGYICMSGAKMYVYTTKWELVTSA